MDHPSQITVPRAQSVSTCDLCDNSSKQFCNSCQVRLCDDCISRHKEEFLSLSHDIVPLRDKIIRLAFPKCQSHPGKRCEAHCQQCKISICIKCLTGLHNGHKAEDLTLETRLREIEYETKTFEAIINTYEGHWTFTGRQKAEEKEKFAKLQNKIKEDRQVWHNRVDTIFHNIESLRESLRDGNLDALRAHQNKIKSVISDMTGTIKQNERILQSNKLRPINYFEYKLKNYRQLSIPEKVSSEVPEIMTNVTQESELSIELGEIKASITQMSKINQSK